MKTWAIWLLTGVLFIFIVAGFVGVSLWNNLKTEWTVEQATAQYALNHSPINSIRSHDVSTESGAQEIFTGKDPFGRIWYVAVFGDPFQIESIQASAVKPNQTIVKQATADGLQVISSHFGYLDGPLQSHIGTNAKFIWEVYGKTNSGAYAYRYFDAQTGKLIQSY